MKKLKKRKLRAVWVLPCKLVPDADYSRKFLEGACASGGRRVPGAKECATCPTRRPVRYVPEKGGEACPTK